MAMNAEQAARDSGNVATRDSRNVATRDSGDAATGDSGDVVVALEPPEEDVRRKFPDLHHAATEGIPSVKDIVQSHELIRRAGQEDHAAGCWLLDRLWSRFPGEIKNVYYCDRVSGGCLLSWDHKLHSILNKAPWELTLAENECKKMVLEAHHVFHAGDGQLEAATDHAYSALSSVMHAADQVVGTSEDAKAEIIFAATHEVRTARQRVDELLQRQSRIEYFQGVLFGALPMLVVAGLVGWAADVWWRIVINPTAHFTGAIIMATLGAIVSVVQRMSTANLVVDHTASVRQRLILGGLRPAIGAAFGAVAYFALLTVMLAATGSTGSSIGHGAMPFAFFALAGFAAGFCERFAPDMLERPGTMPGADTADSAGEVIVEQRRALLRRLGGKVEEE